MGEGLSETEFYGDLVYKFKKLTGRKDFSFQFRIIITRYRRIAYNLNVMRQSACLVFNPIMVDNYDTFFNCTPVGRASDSMMARTFSLPLTKVDIHFGHVRMCAMPYPISWIIFILDLGPSYTDKLLEFQWVQIAHLS